MEHVRRWKRGVLHRHHELEHRQEPEAADITREYMQMLDEDIRSLIRRLEDRSTRLRRDNRSSQIAAAVARDTVGFAGDGVFCTGAEHLPICRGAIEIERAILSMAPALAFLGPCGLEIVACAARFARLVQVPPGRLQLAITAFLSIAVKFISPDKLTKTSVTHKGRSYTIEFPEDVRAWLLLYHDVSATEVLDVECNILNQIGRRPVGSTALV